MTLTAAIGAYKNGNWAEASRLCEEGIPTAESAGDELEVCRFRLVLSLCRWAQGRIEEAFDIPVPSVHGPVGLEIAARCRNQKGFLLSQIGKFQEAKTELAEALRLSQELSAPQLSFEIETTRATLFFYLAEYDSMLVCGQAAVEIAEKNGLSIAGACSVIGKSFMVRKKWTEAIAWYERALAACEADGLPFYVDGMRGELGCCYLGLGELDKAMQLFSKALQSSAGTVSMHTNLANIGCVYLRQGECHTALSYFQKALELARGLGDQISTAKWLRNISLAYKGLGDTMQATSYGLEAEKVEQQVAQARAAASR
jgi:tetratricopeptide (TPR) repeat protein